MHIRITRRLFTEDPSQRFSRSFKCSPDIWRGVWRRYKLLDYTEEEAHEYLMYVLKQTIRKERFRRWLYRTEAYQKAQIALQKGAQEVKLDYFGSIKPFITRELTKNK